MLSTRPLLSSALLGVALLAHASPAVAGDVTVHAAVPAVMPPGWELHKLTPVDLDGDGLLDLVGSGKRAILWRQVQCGTLTPIPLTSLPGLAVVVDLDEDGQLSIVCASSSPGLVTQEFVAPFVLGPETALTGTDDAGGGVFVVTGDLDGDGHVDVLADGATQGGLRVWPGDGLGGLLPSVQAADVNSVPTELGDLDLDGTLDLLAGVSDSVVPLLGQGDGTFVAQPPIPVPTFISEIALGQLNADGQLDAAVAGNMGTQLLLGTGGGDFQPWTFAPGNLRAVDLGDADGDGDDDLVTASSAQAEVKVQLVDAGGLGATRSFLVQPGLWDVVLAPLHPGAPPTVLVARAVFGYGDVVLADCGPDGLPALEQQFANAPSSAPLALADVDGDGHDELVALQTLSGTIVVHEIPGDGTIGPASTGTPIAVGSSVRPIDLGGDAFEDLLVSTHEGQEGTWLPWLSNGDGTFTPGTIIHHQQPAGSWRDAVGDVDGDGDDDLLISFKFDTTSSIVWLANLGGGSFAPAVAVSLPGVLPAASIALADADEDGLADAFTITGASPAVMTWWKGAGDGSFSAPQVLASGPQSGFGLIATDLDGDGHVDVAAHGQTPFGELSTALLTVVYGHGDGRFDAPRLFPAGGLAAGDPPAVADFDGDGRVDVLVLDLTSNRTVLLPQAADGSFGEALPLAFEFPVQQGDRILTADVDGDGDQDFLSYALTGGSQNPKPLRVGWVDVQPDGLNLGHAKVGTVGAPVLTGGGDLHPTQAAHIDMGAAPPSVPLLLLVGLETGYQPLAGGTLVPLPQGVLGFSSSAEGSFELLTRWPADAPPGLAVYAQCWCTDPLTGEAVASNALQFEGE